MKPYNRYKTWMNDADMETIINLRSTVMPGELVLATSQPLNALWRYDPPTRVYLRLVRNAKASTSGSALTAKLDWITIQRKKFPGTSLETFAKIIDYRMRDITL